MWWWACHFQQRVTYLISLVVLNRNGSIVYLDSSLVDIEIHSKFIHSNQFMNKQKLWQHYKCPTSVLLHRLSSSFGMVCSLRTHLTDNFDMWSCSCKIIKIVPCLVPSQPWFTRQICTWLSGVGLHTCNIAYIICNGQPATPSFILNTVVFHFKVTLTGWLQQHH